MTTPTPSTVDPMDDMVAAPYVPKPQESTFFGQVAVIDRSDWKLVKGQGRVPFDAVYDDQADRVRGITIQIECEKRDGGKFTIDTGRSPLLEIEKAWHGFTLKSLQKLGVPLSQLRGAFVQVRRVETGEKYTNQQSGEQKAKTALEFVAVYPDWHAMNAARDQLFGSRTGRAASPAAPAPAPAPVAPAVDRSALEKLLPALWQAAGRDRAVFTTMFQGNPALVAAFTLDEAIEAASLPF